MVPPIVARVRNAAATRQTILASARYHFARDSYDNVGLREIAGDAGVDPALVSRYFGGKEQLFKEALRGDKQHMMRGVERADLPEHLANLLLEDESNGEDAAATTERLLIILRSTSSLKAAEIIRDAMNEDILRPVASLLEGDDAQTRASLCLAVLLGAGILKSSIALEPLCSGSEGELRNRLIRLFAAALEDAR